LEATILAAVLHGQPGRSGNVFMLPDVFWADECRARYGRARPTRLAQLAQMAHFRLANLDDDWRLRLKMVHANGHGSSTSHPG
jgi:hypothetical protein